MNLPKLDDPSFWRLPHLQREEGFRLLREHAPITYFENGNMDIPDSEHLFRGAYVLSKYGDIVDATRRPEVFCSRHGASSLVPPPMEVREFFGSMIELDDPRHKRLRDLVSKAFTVRHVRQIEDHIERTAREIVSVIASRGEIDFVADCAARLPLQVICDLVGVPSSLRTEVFEVSNTIMGLADPDYVTPGNDPIAVYLDAKKRLIGIGIELAEQRSREPEDDLMTALAHTEIDGERLTVNEIAMFFDLLVLAGNETTRNSISWGLKLLTEHPGQREIWMEDFDGVQRTAIDEIVRTASPVMFMQRTVTQDGAQLSGHEFREGDKVLMYYLSGNRDEDMFEDPFRFDVRREPNAHLGFGGPGPHFCLGANLARQEMKVIFRELFRELPDMEMSGEPEHLSSNFINGIKRLPARFTPRRIN